ncbi:hypothetical protein H8K47_07995 [Undibacterium sp. CY7W]|uniref:Darcynin n=1 Tax=Undibacterium rugosum TaxID=2762291 RepID=A0A923KZ23_9BURK|nr:darcynin family protein [Undibacterium rugosum]MBC3935298.1 hypothetical protein [Undibacterium rugosum]
MNQHPFTIFVHLKADISWLALNRQERKEFTQTKVFPILKNYPDIRHAHFDAEAFSGITSDIEMFTCDDIRRFYSFFEEFRDSELISKGFFSIVNIFPTIADGYVEFEAAKT